MLSENVSVEREVFSYQDALKASLEYFKNDELAAKVFVDKYALRDGDKILEDSPVKMHRRIAKEFARIEKNKFEKPLSENEIFDLLDQFKYIIPQGSPMYGIGNKYQYLSLGNCFVLPSVQDSYGGILLTDQQLVQLSKRRAGVGFDISHIRPKGLPTKNAAKTTDGIGVFMDRFSSSIREVAQNGRRGALMLTISVHHPEIETFITIKRNLKRVTGANISVKITDEFMDAVRKDEDYEQRWPINSNKPILSKKVKAKEIWDKIIESNHQSAEPGMLFWDNLTKYGLSDQYKTINPLFEDLSTNPCGEIGMGVDSCRLMLVNLFSYVKKAFTKEASFDFQLFGQHVQICQRLMDDLIDLEIECIGEIISKIKSDPQSDEIKTVELNLWKMMVENCKLGRRTGLGITALGDTLAALGVKYGSEESIKKTEKIYKEMAINSLKSSCLMAKEIGSFPLYDKKVEKNNIFLERLLKCSDELRELHDKYGRRNISLTTTAPAGTVSILTQTTSGIEPVFMLKYTRRRKISSDDKNSRIDFTDESGDRWEETTVYHQHLKTWMDVTGETDIKKSPYWQATSGDIDWLQSVEIQAVAQKYVSHSISKTCNVPSNTSKDILSQIYLKAYESGCKGFTVYRDGCRDGVLVNNEEIKDKNQIIKTIAPKRPKSLDGEIHHFIINKQKYYVVVGLLKGDVYEVFTGINHDDDGEIYIPKTEFKGKIKKEARGKYHIKTDNGNYHLTNGHSDDSADALTRLCSCALRHGTDISFIVSQFEKTKGPMNSFSKALARTLKHYIKNDTVVAGEECPTCKSSLIRENGCKSCKSCGYSVCS